MRCPACGSENAEASRFCGSCGAGVAVSCPHCYATVSVGLRFCTTCGGSVAPPDQVLLAEPAAPVDPASSERRRVSILFLDLEDFTTIAESLDPEELRALQSRYFETARSLIGRYGGTVEKFIGDAVMAVWGAPSAHEDDPARAVQAALALVRAVGGLTGSAAAPRLRGRAAVTTGEVAVTIGAVGQGMVAGDLVNVASRLQNRAPAGGVLVDRATRDLAHAAADYEAIGALELKGRAAPLEAFRVTAPREAGWGGRSGSHGGPFVGRDRELRELVDLWDGVVRDGRSRLVSVTGIAGIGKSRLAWELRQVLDARPDIIAWHAGRAPAYGEEITFAAVAEMVRRRIRVSEGAGAPLAGLAPVLTDIVRDEDERRWMEPRLAVLLGREGLGDFSREELFAAWRRFFERVSDAMPTVLVFEDLQWADPTLVDFVEHLAAWTRAHPILILVLARPELLDRRPTWGSGIGRFTALHLERLPDSAMRTILEQRAPELPRTMVRRVLEHAGGVPLYAVEIIRAAADQGAADGATRQGEERRTGHRIGDAAPAPRLSVPDSLRGLIAARIDALPPAERRLLLAAAVLGRRFRPDALLAIGADAATAQDRIDSLIRRELLAFDEEAGLPGRGELAFIQDLVRDVAYGTLSRSERRTLHLAAARWLEGLPEDEAAESLAGHLTQAHALAPEHPDARRIARRAVSALRRAAAAALTLHVPERALGHLEQALRLTDSGEQRALVLSEVATAASSAARLELAEEHLRELARVQADGGHRREAARTRARLASVLLMAQRNEAAVAELDSALRAIRDVGRDASGVELAAQLARARVLIGDHGGGLTWADRALAAAERLSLEHVAADVLVTRGTARFALGQDEGLDDLRRAIDEASRIGSIGIELRARNNLAWLLMTDDPRATLETARQAVELATSMGVGDLAAQLAEVACAAAVETGDWTWALETAGELEDGTIPVANRINLAATSAVIRALRGEADPLAPVTRLEPLPDDLDSQIVAGLDLARAWVAFVAGEVTEARGLARRAAAGSLGAERSAAHALAARASLWAGDAAAAAAEIAAVESIEIRGRAVEAEVMTLRAGLLAFEDPGAAHARYRAAGEAWRSLELAARLALCLADEHRLLAITPSPELLSVLEELEGAGLRALMVSGSAGPARSARSRPPSADTAARSDGGRPRRRGRDRRSPAG